MMPFIDFVMLGEKNKHYEMPLEKKIVLNEEPLDSLLEKLRSAKVIFIHGDHFPEWSHFFIEQVLEKNIRFSIRLFLSFGSDYDMLEGHLDLFADLYSDSRFWFQNWCGNLSNVEILPIGFDNKAGEITIDPSNIEKKYTVVISSFTINSVPRKEFCGFLDKHSELACICAPFYSDKNEFFKMLASHYFSICCAGNGYDTYRFWESIHAKSVPIVIKNEFTQNLHKQYPNLPMILLDSWEDLLHLLARLNKNFYNTFWENADIACATNKYWHSRLSGLVSTP